MIDTLALSQLEGEDEEADHDQDLTLVRATLGGEVAAFGKLVEIHKPRVHCRAYSLTGSRHDADDVTQEVFLRAYQHLDQYDPERGTFPNWLGGITTNECRTLWRRVQQWTHYISLELELSNGRDPPDDSVVDAESVLVRQAVQRLEPPYREVIVLVDYEGLSYEEAAKQLGCSKNTIGTRRHRGLAKLRRQIEVYRIRGGRL